MPATTRSVYIEEQSPSVSLLDSSPSHPSSRSTTSSSNLSRHSLFSFRHSLQDHNSYLLKAFAMKYSVSAIVLGFFAALNAAVPTPGAPGAGQVTMTKYTYAGSGCKAGTASISYSEALQTLTILFDEFGPYAPPYSTNCDVNIQFHYPSGYQFTLYKYDYTGYAQLEPGVIFKQTSSYRFVGSNPTLQFIFPGPYDGDYTYTETLESTSWAWSPCGGSTTMNINTQARLQGHDLNYISVNAYKNKHVYGLNWRECRHQWPRA